MTQEQKAKRYDEAIEKAGEIHNEHKAQPFDVMLKVFPELKESDDEKIRNEILSFLKEGKHYHCPNSAKRQRWIAWLEKQDEQKAIEKVEPKFKVGDKVYALRNRFECTIESIDETTYYGDTTNFDIKDQDNWKLVEQKPAWSEEDERNINFLMNLIRLQIPDKMYSFGYDDNMKYVTKEEAVDMLKSLKERFAWKPSDGQISLLQSIVNDSNNAASESCQITLKEVIKQLKKLKG